MRSARKSLAVMGLVAVALLLQAGGALASGVDWTAFNDITYQAPYTHPNTTLYQFTGGALKDIVTGAALPVTLTVSSSGVPLEGWAIDPNSGTDAYNIFNGYVGFRGSNNGGPDSSLALDNDADYYTLGFSGLGPGKKYNFAGASIRGNPDYTNRWTIFTLLGADTWTNAHSIAGSGIYYPGQTVPGGLTLGQNQVAIWTGDNRAGLVSQWTDIDPGSDGVFEVKSTRLSVAPGAGGGVKCYAIAGFRLEQTPEPATLALLAAGGVLALLRRRRR